MARIATDVDTRRITDILSVMIEEHSPSTLAELRDELNKIFPDMRCRDIIYTDNTDKIFFGIKVYPLFDGFTAITLMGDTRYGDVKNFKNFDSYYVEFDSKLLDPILNLDEIELFALLIHEIYAIVGDETTVDEVRKQIDLYYTKMDDAFDPKMPKGYSELLAYGIKDALNKIGSVFTRIGNEEVHADELMNELGLGQYYESAARKLSRSDFFINRATDERLIALAWVLRLKHEYNTNALPAIKTLKQAQELTGSELERRELSFASSLLSHMDPFKESAIVNESFFDNVRSRFSKKFDAFKMKGIRSIKNDVYELALRMRAAETEMDLLYIIRTVNTDVAILRDYLTEDLPEEERAEVVQCLQDLYAIREKCAKDKEIKDRYDSLIQVAYLSN